MGAGRWLLQAFYDLDTERQIGMAAGPIPFFAIISYADRYGLGEDFVAAIQSLDRFYLKDAQDGVSTESVNSKPKEGAAKEVHGTQAT